MANRLASWWLAGIALLVMVSAGHAGGWWTITIRDLPEHVVAGKRFQLTFMARAHGVSPVEDLDQEVVAVNGGESTRGRAVPTRKAGEYTVSLLLPHPGRWTIKFNELALPEVTAITPGSPTPPPLSPSASGARLFVSKGCITCHENRDLQPHGGGVGPDLTDKRFDEAYLKRFLADPQKVRPRSPDSVWEMPDLDLAKAEIAALVTFMNQPRQ